VSHLIFIRDIKNPVFAFCLNLTFHGKTWDGITSFFAKEGTSEEHAAITSELAF